MFIFTLIISFILLFVSGLFSHIFDKSTNNRNASIIYFLMLLTIFFMLLSYKLKNKDDLTKSFIKDNKIEWRINTNGDKYLLLKDSTLINTWTNIITDSTILNTVHAFQK